MSSISDSSGVGRNVPRSMTRDEAKASAERLGATVAIFPSGHGGFLGDEYGHPGDPEAFAATLREVLAEA